MNAEQVLILFTSMLFGFKAAPLIFGRFAAALGRLLQSLFHSSEARLQIYLDDPLWLLTGPKWRRDRALALILFTLRALGINVAWHKGERGSNVNWIGVNFQLDWASSMMLLRLPEKMMAEILQETKDLMANSMVPVGRLRRFTGRMTWAAGVLLRARWTVAILYAVMTSYAADWKEGKEESRAARRKDKRPKKGLIPTKLIMLALVWIEKLCLAQALEPVRRLRLQAPTLQWTVVTDASPWGLGAILAYTQEDGTFHIVEGFESPVTQADADFLGFDLHQASSQAIVEALAVLVAFKHWGKRFVNNKLSLELRSDSTAALAMTSKLASSSPSINFLGAELALELEALETGKVFTLHVPGKLNTLADWLSRPNERKGKSKPEGLDGVKVKVVKPRSESYYKLPGPGRTANCQPSLWGQSSSLPWILV
jgi:hypothetical protein